jgi:hypothetical protein
MDNKSPFIESNNQEQPKSSINTYIQKYTLSIVVIVIIFYILYKSYNNFYANQDTEPFIEKTIKTGIDDDKSFDVDTEVSRLSNMQESYLKKLNSRRNN